MRRSRLIHLPAGLVCLLSLTHCGDDGSDSDGTANTCYAGDPACAAAGGSGSSVAGPGTTTTTTPGAGTGTTQPSTGPGTATPGTATGTTGATTPTGTATSPGTATPGTGATGTTTPTGTAGTTGTTGTTTPPDPVGTGATGSTTVTPPSTGGATGGAGATGGVGATGAVDPGPIVDEGGEPLAKPGDQKTTPSDYLNLGEIRVLNNRWGSDERGCDTQLDVFINADRSFGWNFNRGGCGGEGTQPDFPEVEFGVHPFGAGHELETSPPFSSTALLPLQIKDITSAGVQVSNMNIDLQGAESWNISFELWLSERNPTEPNPGVYAEILAMWGWQDGRWACGDDNDPDSNEYQGQSVTAGDKTYDLCHHRDDWADGQWRYWQLRMAGGPSRNFSGRVDAKAFLDWIVNTQGYSSDLWVTRLEVGSEIDDNTSGRVTIGDIAFEVNGETRSPQFGE